MNTPAPHTKSEAQPRRDFLYVATGSMGAVALGASVWPLIDALNPSADVLSLSSVEIDASCASSRAATRSTRRVQSRPCGSCNRILK